MRYLVLLLIPSIALAQTPTPTPDPDRALARQFKVSVLDVRLGKAAQAINDVRALNKAEREGRIVQGNESLVTLTPAQKAALRTKRNQKINRLRAICQAIETTLPPDAPTPTPEP